ncbi:MAG: PAS domain S-box protein [Planctomycetales bacterium]|nr:PAS domain S-box protein [Planctomycetales bacterium]
MRTDRPILGQGGAFVDGFERASGDPVLDFSRVLIVAPDDSESRQLCQRLDAAKFDSSVCPSIDQAAMAMFRERYSVAVVRSDVLDASANSHQETAAQEILPRLTVASKQRDWQTRLILWRSPTNENESPGSDDSGSVMADPKLAEVFWAVTGDVDSLMAETHHAVRLQMADALGESERRYRRLMDNSNDAILIAEADSGRIIDANVRARQLVGHSLRELQRMQQADIHPAEEHDLFKIVFDQQRLRPGLVTELHVLHRSGRRVPVEISCSELGSSGQALVQTILRNVTDRKRSEQALRMSDERFRQLTENIDEVFWLIDWTTLTALYVSPAYESIWGRSCESAIANPDGPIGYVYHEDAQRVRDAFRWEAPHGRFDEEFRVVRPDGEMRWIRQRAFPIYNSNGELYRIAAIASDVTERRLVQDELQKRNSELAHLSRLSTMGEMLAELAHEINQPLYAISNYADACSNILKSRPPEMEQYVQQWTSSIAVQAKRAGDIIRRIGRFLRKDTPNYSHVDINELVDGTLELLELELNTQNIVVRRSFAEPLPEVFVTPLHIEQVLVNLLRNSVDALRNMPRGDRLISIETRLLDDSWIEIAISDNGHGIDSHTAERLFEPFFTTKTDGIGLGLAVCQSTVRTYGGVLRFVSEVDRGTTFRFTLPSGASHADAAPGRPLASAGGVSSS